MATARPLNLRSELVALVRENAPTKAAARAVDEGREVVLGGFTPAEGLPCWVVRITSRHGREWLVAVHVDEENRRFSIRHPDRVHWGDWSGIEGRNNPVYDGDCPDEFAAKRKDALHAALD